MPAAKTPSSEDRSEAAINARLAAAASPLAKLRVPFSANQVSKLPKQIKSGPQDRFNCIEGHTDFRKASKDGIACGGYHGWAVHLDYVGHAALTDRLLEVDPEWDWEPVAFDANGLPLFDHNGGLWIRLTIAETTRLGYGDSQGKTGPNAVKEAIGDALRNAGMRFGMALDLWHKGDLHDAAEEQGNTDQDAPPKPAARSRAAAKPPAAAVAAPEPEADTPMALADLTPEGDDPDLVWIERAQKATDLAVALDVWRAAKREFSKEPSARRDEVLAQIVRVCEQRRDEEARAADVKAAAEKDAHQALAAGFQGEPQ